MAVLPILEVPDPRLRLVSTPVEAVDDEVRALIADMFDTMYDAPGIGLAAIQVGVRQARRRDRPAGASEDEDGKPIRDPHVFINPEILVGQRRTVDLQRGLPVDPRAICRGRAPRALPRALARRRRAQAHEEELDGLLATCMQHEMDHLRRHAVHRSLSRLKRDMMLKKLAKAAQGGLTRAACRRVTFVTACRSARQRSPSMFRAQ